MPNNKILLLTDDMLHGGAERQLAYLAIGLKKQQYDVRLIKFYPGENFYSKELDENKIKTEIFVRGKKRLKRIHIIYKLIKEWKPNMVICYKPGSSMAASIARMFLRFNLVVSERNTTQLLTRSERLKFLLYKSADHIVSNSFSQEEFIKKNFPKLLPKVKVITNMVDIEKFSPSTKEIINETPQIITTARIAPQKNVINYLLAVSELKKRGLNAKFNWYGSSFAYENYWEEVKDLIKKLNIADMIVFQGTTKDIVSEYRKNDIFVLPSNYEGFPNVLCEAMACGLPSITTWVSDCPKIINDKRWLADPQNPIDIANRIQDMLEISQEERQLIGKRNRDRIVELCSSNEFINKYVNLL